MEYQKRQVMMKAKRKAAAKMEELHDAAQIQLSLQDQVGVAGLREPLRAIWYDLLQRKERSGGYVRERKTACVYACVRSTALGCT